MRRRQTEAQRAALAAPPFTLDDDSGEGIYFRHDDDGWSPLHDAADWMLGSRDRWREIDHETVVMEPPPDGEAWRAKKRMRTRSIFGRRIAVAFTYCTPRPAGEDRNR